MAAAVVNPAVSAFEWAKCKGRTAPLFVNLFTLSGPSP